MGARSTARWPEKKGSGARTPLPSIGHRDDFSGGSLGNVSLTSAPAAGTGCPIRAQLQMRLVFYRERFPDLLAEAAEEIVDPEL
jgi:hypothetical protein